MKKLMNNNELYKGNEALLSHLIATVNERIPARVESVKQTLSRVDRLLDKVKEEQARWE